MHRLRRNTKYISRRQAVSWLGFELRSSPIRSRHPTARCIAMFGDQPMVSNQASGEHTVTNRSVKRNRPRSYKASIFHLQSAQLYRAISYPALRRNRQSWFPEVPVFQHVTPCRPVQVCSRFRGTCCLHHPRGSTPQRRQTFTKLYGVISQTRYFLVNATNFKPHLIPEVHKFPKNVEATSKLLASERRRQAPPYKI